MEKVIAIRSNPLAKIIALSIVISLTPATRLFAQDNPVKEFTYYATGDVKTQSPPLFPGGHEKLKEFIRSEIENSPNGVKLGRKVYITAQIDESGKVIKLKPAYNVEPLLEKELQRIAALMPLWQAGTVNGKGVLTDYTFLIKSHE